MHTAAPLPLTDVDRDVLLHWTCSSSMSASQVLRAQIVLAAADGESNTAIAERLAVTRQTVVTWRARYAAAGLGGLGDRKRPGRPQVLDPLEILARTMEDPPASLGVARWSSRLLAAELGVSNATVANIWREHDLQPWRTKPLAFPTTPRLDAKIRAVVGLYLASLVNAVVVRADEKPQIQPPIQPPNGTTPMLPPAPGLPQPRYDYSGEGRTSPFAAREVATGIFTADVCYPQHEFLAFLKRAAKAYPAIKLHVVCDNDFAHQMPEVAAWLERHPRITLHYTPTSTSWLNIVEIFFAVITRQAPQPAILRTVHDLTAAIRRFIDAYNERALPHSWIKTAG